MAMLSTMLSLLLIGATLYFSFNIQLYAGHTLCLAAALTLALGALTQEKFPVFVSVILSAIWVGNAYLEPDTTHLLWLFPTFFVVQYWLSSKMRARAALIFTCLTIVAWFCSQVFQISLKGALPVTLVLGLMLMLGLAYNRLGKTMQDRHKPTGLMHTNMAWVLGVGSALGLQHFWGSPTMSALSETYMAQDSIVLFGVIISMALTLLIIGTSIIRTRLGHQSRSETLAITGIAFAMIILVNNPGQFIEWATAFTATPFLTLGFVIAGIVAAASVAMFVNGARRGKPSMIILGIVALIAELYLVIPNLIAQPEYLYAFGYSGLFSLLFLALFAQKNINARTPRRLQYA